MRHTKGHGLFVRPPPRDTGGQVGVLLGWVWALALGANVGSVRFLVELNVEAGARGPAVDIGECMDHLVLSVATGKQGNQHAKPKLVSGTFRWVFWRCGGVKHLISSPY